MSTTETTNGRGASAPKFCQHCGTPRGAGAFCAGCGRPHDVEAEPPAIDSPDFDRASTTIAREAGDATFAHAQAPGAATVSRPAAPLIDRAHESHPRSRRGLIAGVALGALALAGGVAAAVVLLSSGSGGQSPEPAYRQQVAKAFGPVLGANRAVSDQLDRLGGKNVTSARAAVRDARQATTLAMGAIRALDVPAGGEAMSRDARQVLDRETAYLSAVGSVLANPSSPNRSQLQTLSSNLASALSAAGPSVGGTSETVSGADRLTAWAQRIARRSRSAGAGRQAAPVPAQPTSPQPTGPSGHSCGSGVYANANTSCAFAFNVRDAYYAAPGIAASVRVFSPVTGETYTMNCAPSGSGITCSGANSASVTF